MSSRPTIKSVAAEAGVSTTTVSLVVNNNADAIPETTRERVWQAVRKLGYRPNPSARALSSSQTHTIGFITDVIASSGYAGRTIVGAQELSWANDKVLLIVNTGGDAAITRAAVDMLRDRQVDGIIYAAMSMCAVELPAELLTMPTVLVNAYDPRDRFPSILADEELGGYTATRALIEAGHRRIGLLYGLPEVDAGRERLAGYRRALAEADIAWDDRYVRSDCWFPEGGHRSTMALMALEQQPTALFCINDWVAMGCYEALKELGLSIPKDVAVVGYDNHELAGLLRPGLTTMQLPHYELGRKAVEYLLGSPEAQAANRMIRVPCPLIRRSSI
ncbi:LacI family DNA-binding transcriptional regulator (plasmid) [Azospirillum sp. A26]|uniref:LacI family DNA-binding transcriptional regulator n=1 Tax=Azospirillum sp. A26 TaxID=3160607 RepID=UPI00366D9F6B